MASSGPPHPAARSTRRPSRRRAPAGQRPIPTHPSWKGSLMSNDRDDHEIHEFGDEFADDYRAARFEAAEDFPGPDGPGEFPGERGRRHGPRRSHEHAHGPRGRRGQDNPWDAIFGPEGPFGPRGPLAKGGIFGPQGADVARTIWENATSGSSPWQPGPHRGRSPWEPQDARPQEAREWRTSDAPSQRGRDGERRHGRPGGPRGSQSDDGSARGRRGGPGGRRGGRRPRGDVRLAALLLIAEEQWLSGHRGTRGPDRRDLASQLGCRLSRPRAVGR